jgi:hypothetical protein
MKAKVKSYEGANKSQIVIRQSRRADEERSIADRIAAEQREAERRKREVKEEERAVALTKCFLESAKRCQQNSRLLKCRDTEMNCDVKVVVPLPIIQFSPESENPREGSCARRRWIASCIENDKVQVPASRVVATLRHKNEIGTKPFPPCFHRLSRSSSYITGSNAFHENTKSLV